MLGENYLILEDPGSFEQCYGHPLGHIQVYIQDRMISSLIK